MISSQEAMELEQKYGATNYAPLPVVISKGKGALVWDPEGKQYFDFLSGIAAVSQGHCHPKILAALTTQAERLTLISRAFYSDVFGPYAKYITRYFGFDRVLAMNTGVEAAETALKLARKWGYQVKGIAENRAKILFCQDNFHGRTLGAISASGGAETQKMFGPLLPNFHTIPYNNLEALREAVSDPTVAAFVIEPIQGEGGVVVPAEGYLREARELCRKANVLFVADEIQTGIARTGKLLACDYEEVRPDILVLGKALTGGVLPSSAVLADDAVMSCFKPGDHGSTYGGNPLACAVVMAALEVVKEENLAANAFEMGELFRSEVRKLNSPLIAEVRGKGLLNAIVLNVDRGVKASDLCLKLRDHGLIAKNTREHVIRFAPPLVIQRSQMLAALKILETVFKG